MSNLWAPTVATLQPILRGDRRHVDDVGQAVASLVAVAHQVRLLPLGWSFTRSDSDAL